MSRPDADAFLRHLEAALGPLVESESVLEKHIAAEGLGEFSILAFGDRAPLGLATFGVSRHVLHAGDNDAVQELVLTVSEADFARGALSVLGSHVLETHVPLVAGARHRIGGYDADSQIEGVLAVADELLPAFLGSQPPVELLRLVPITASEAAFAGAEGWEALCDRLAAADTADLRRASVA